MFSDLEDVTYKRTQLVGPVAYIIINRVVAPALSQTFS